jgi:hypothetical protein
MKRCPNVRHVQLCDCEEKTCSISNLMNNMAQQTAVEWLIKRYHDYGTLYYDDMTQAKAMEKEQIEQAFIDGDCGYSPDDGRMERMAKDYYNETYNK